MSLPLDFMTPEDYLNECTEFLRDYSFLYNFPNTDILLLKVLDQIDIDEDNINDMPVFEENFNLPSNKNCDVFLSDFLEKLQKFKVNYVTEDVSFENKFDCPLSPKKQHEIVYLAKKIKEISSSANCNTVVDFGSGLSSRYFGTAASDGTMILKMRGYLDQLLFVTTNLNILGLECNENFYVEAKKRQNKYHGNSQDRVKYKRHKVTENSVINIGDYLDDKFPDRQEFCIAGLHACADLTVTAINIFLKMADARALVIVPCCYHKMTGTGNSFTNFPLSKSLKGIAEKWNHEEFMRVPFLRLAAQPASLDDNLNNRVFNLLSRAVLQLYVVKNNCILKRKKRKAVRVKTMENDFEKYIVDAATGFTVETTDVNKTTVDIPKLNTDELRKIWQELPEIVFKKVAIFILLQDALQPVIENFVLYDRLLYLRENGVANCKYEKIFDHMVSPRCLALIANK